MTRQNEFVDSELLEATDDGRAGRRYKFPGAITAQVQIAMMDDSIQAVINYVVRAGDKFIGEVKAIDDDGESAPLTEQQRHTLAAFAILLDSVLFIDWVDTTKSRFSKRRTIRTDRGQLADILLLTPQAKCLETSGFSREDAKRFLLDPQTFAIE